MNKQYVVMNCDGEDFGYEQETHHLSLSEAISHYNHIKKLIKGRNFVICKVLSQQEIKEAETLLTTAKV